MHTAPPYTFSSFLLYFSFLCPSSLLYVDCLSPPSTTTTTTATPHSHRRLQGEVNCTSCTPLHPSWCHADLRWATRSKQINGCELFNGLPPPLPLLWSMQNVPFLLDCQYIRYRTEHRKGHGGGKKCMQKQKKKYTWQPIFNVNLPNRKKLTEVDHKEVWGTQKD